MSDSNASTPVTETTAYAEGTGSVPFESVPGQAAATVPGGAYASATSDQVPQQPVQAPVPSYEVTYQPQPASPASSAPGYAAPASPVPMQVPQQPVPQRQPVNGFTVAGLVLAIIAFVFAMWTFGDKVSVFGVVALAMGIIGWFYTKDAASTRGERPSAFNTAIVVVVIVFALIAIVMTPLAPYILGHRVF